MGGVIPGRYSIIRGKSNYTNQLSNSQCISMRQNRKYLEYLWKVYIFWEKANVGLKSKSQKASVINLPS